MKRLAIVCALALSASLLSGCMSAVVVTSPRDEEFREDWEESMEERQDDLKEDGEKRHCWKILDLTDPETGAEAGTVTNQEQVELLDDLLSDDENWVRLDGNPGDGAYSYIYCQQETWKAGQAEEDREYEELLRFTVSGSEDAVTMEILADLPSLLSVDLGNLLTFTMSVPAETAEALRDPGQFLK